MAITKTDPKSTAAPAPEATITVDAGLSAPTLEQGVPAGSTVSALLNQLTVGLTGSAAWVDYLKAIKTALTDGGMTVEMRPLAQPMGANVFVVGDTGIVLIPSESTLSFAGGKYPVSELSKAAKMTLKQAMPALRVIDYLVIQPVDYALVNQQIMHLYTCFRAIHDPQYRDMTLAKLSADAQYTIDTAPGAVRQFIAGRYPHRAQPRVDIGILVSLKNTEAQSLVRGGMALADRPFLAVGGYVDFRRNAPGMDGQVRYTPVVHITHIESDFKDLAVALVGIELFAETFVAGEYGHWRSQFNSFGPNEPNIGNLIPDDQNGGAPWRATNPQQRDSAIATHMTPPTLVIDIVEGRARTPGLAVFIQEKNGQLIANVLARFFGQEVPASVAVDNDLVDVDWIGTIGQDLQVTDSRHNDYLRLLSRAGTLRDDYAAAMLVARAEAGQLRARVQQEFSPDFQMLNVNYMVKLSGAWLVAMNAVIKSKLRISGNTGNEGYINLGSNTQFQELKGLSSSVSGLGAGFGSANLGGVYAATW